jgi:type II restriction enzyme
MKLLARKNISAKSNETITDLELVIQDPITGGPQPRSGYSIKSQLGQTSTLLNSSGSTNIIYKIESKQADSEPILQGTSHRKNIQSLYEQGFELIFDSYQRDTFRTNLSFIDSQLPINLPKVVLKHYLVNDTSDYSATVEKVFSPGSQENEQVIYKFKQLLLAVSMGLRPAKEWKGNLEKFKGLLIVNRSGEILFYPQETKLNFQDFLYRNVRFDRPDSRLKYGMVYKLNGKFFIKLNFQIRFK